MKVTKTKKTTKSVKLPKLVADFTCIERPLDIYYETVFAKIRAGIAITESDAAVILNTGALDVIDTMTDFLKEVEKDTKVIVNDELVGKIIDLVEQATDPKPKKPWYKRFWSWLTRKK